MSKFLLPALATTALILGACGDAKIEAPESVAAATDKMAEKTAEMKDTMAEKASAMMETKTTAVLVYADWCGSCKVLDPAVKKVQAMGKIPGVEFVVLDYTDKDADAFYAQAETAGVKDAVIAYQDGTIKTGQLLLVDMDDDKVISKITKDSAAPEILAKIKDALAAS